MQYRHIQLDYLLKHAEGKKEIIHEMLRLSILNIKLYRQEINEYFKNESWFLMGESAYWAKEKLPLVGLIEVSRKLGELEKLSHKGNDVAAMKEIVDYFDKVAPEIILELEDAMKKNGFIAEENVSD